MCFILQEDSSYINLRCPNCKIQLIKYRYSETRQGEINCHNCGNKIIFYGDHIDARITKDFPRDFSRQWIMWEKGLLGDPNLVYGESPIKHFNGVLSAVGLSENDLPKMKILEIGFGHGKLLEIFQRYSLMAYGIDLVKPLESTCLHSGSVFCGDLFDIPITPKQFDLVICKGVIQHTGDAKKAFGQVAAQVANKGILYLTVYEKFAKKSLMLRRVFPYSWLYPESVRLALAKIIGIVRASYKTLITNPIDFKRFKTEYGNYKLSTYDVISPKWTSTHKKEEVLSWFKANDLDVNRVSSTVYVGKRK